MRGARHRLPRAGRRRSGSGGTRREPGGSQVGPAPPSRPRGEPSAWAAAPLSGWAAAAGRKLGPPRGASQRRCRGVVVFSRCFGPEAEAALREQHRREEGTASVSDPGLNAAPLCACLASPSLERAVFRGGLRLR